MGNCLEKLKLYKTYLLGLLALFFANVIWILSAELMNFIFKDPLMNKPYLGSYIKTSCFSLFLLILFSKAPRDFIRNRNDLDSLILEKLENVQDYQKPELPPIMSRKKFIILCCFVGPVLMLSIWFYQLALAYTTPAYVMVLGSTQTLFFLFLASFMPSGKADHFDLTKLYFSVIVVLGAILVNNASPPSSSQETKVYDYAWLGNIFAVLSGLAYSSMMVVIQSKVNKGKVQQYNFQERREALGLERLASNGIASQPSILLIFGLGGLFAIFVFFPGFFIVHFTGLERLPCELIPNSINCTVNWKMWTGFFANGVCSSVGGELLWLQGSILTSAIVGGMALNFITPMSIATDYLFYGLKYGTQFQLGNLVILSSIIFTMLTNGPLGQKIKRIVYKCRFKLTEEESYYEVPQIKENALESTIPSWDFVGDSIKGIISKIKSK